MNKNPSQTSNSIKPSNISASKALNEPLSFFQPYNIIVFISFFSPVILATIIAASSFMNQNANGFIYLGFLLASVVVRSYIYMMSGSKDIIVNDNTICTSVQYSKYGNASFTAFVNSFTAMYLLLPMFTNNNANYFILAGLIVYFCLDIAIKSSKKCIKSYSDLIINVLFGLSLAAIIVTLMYSGGSVQYLFFDSSSSSSSSSTTTSTSSSSNNVQCSMPTKQTFKCAVYKNGELNQPNS